jgi:hypothetical protein
VKEAIDENDAKSAEFMLEMDNKHMNKMDNIQYSIQEMVSQVHMERRES